MEETKPNNSPAGEEPVDLIFSVMPQDRNFRPSTPPMASTTPSYPPTEPAPVMPSKPKSGNNSLFYIVVAVIIIAILAGGAYYLLGSKTKKDEPVSRLSKSWLGKYFNVEVCASESTCAENADPDKDGLNNYNEFKADTNPINPDTDEDGLADGDEINIFLTEPDNKITDTRTIARTNNWTDGFQLKGGYDPITPGNKLSETRLQQIEAAIKQYGTHEPTNTTLKPIEPELKIYSNTEYGFEFKYPVTWDSVVETNASLSDYLPDAGKRIFVGIRVDDLAQDYQARIDVYPTKLATVLAQDPFLKGKTSTTVTINGSVWTKVGIDAYLIEKSGKTYDVSAPENIATEIVTTFKFTK